MMCQFKQGQILKTIGWLNSRNIWTSLTVNTDKKIWYSPDKKRRESWNAPEEREIIHKDEWQGVFHHFMPKKGISPDVVRALQKGIDLRPSAIKNWFKTQKHNYKVIDQSISRERIAVLGFDLAAAHFLVHREGKVRFQGSEVWTQQDENGDYELASHYSPNVFVEAIDATGVDLKYEGLESMCTLNHLKWLSVAGCPSIDDWCIDRICCQYSNTLEYLDISNCIRVTELGISALARLRNLKHLHLNGLDDVNNIKLLCLLLEDVIPNIQIEGIQYLDPKLLQNT
ncbi:distal membrane-arm assembly complex protein 2 isoform X2 [Procambarus clarkii]|uniref:distal membrane-arm assembly complex protein 2 isoform X2 n=1 Tax=Procambarus clarkii TaxID=6728 RepID=UPI001E672D71|nr:distal membrane-arm assembly complex protein 2-like isoform X2 [Procambarus clarkii]